MIQRYIIFILFSTFIFYVGCGNNIQKKEISFISGGLILIGDLYISSQKASETGIIFLHGSLPEGRKLLLYHELCTRLAHKGYVVFAFDQRGYGDSEDPKHLRTKEDLDFVSDAKHAVNVFMEHAGRYGVHSVAMVGHSFGGGVAVAAGLGSPHVCTIISISPGRRINDRFIHVSHFDYVQKRKSRDMDLSEPIPAPLIKPMLEMYNIEQFRGVKFPKPLVIIEGNREEEKDLDFTKEFVSTLTGHIDHIIINGAGHYFGTRKIEKWQFRLWLKTNAGLIQQLADAIDREVKRQIEVQSGKL